MKTIKLITLLFIAVIVINGCKSETKSSDPDATVKETAAEMANMKTFIVTYRTTVNAEGMKSVSTTTQWIDNNSDKMAIETDSESEIMGMKQKSKNLIITKGDETYNIDLLTNTGFRSKDKSTEDASPAEIIKSDDDETFRQKIEKEGGKILSNETFLGKDCIVVEMTEKTDGKTMKSKMWYYKGIPLKMTNSFYTMEATKFEENVSIPDSKFEVPQNVKINN